jgi:predicted nuclease of predicted toxin-antitoxin system
VKFKLDENLPASSARSLAGSGHDVGTVAAEGLTGVADSDVAAAAAAEERVLITPDGGMGDLRACPPGSHAGIVVFRLTGQSAPVVDAAITELADWAGLELVSMHGETGLTARLVPFAADGLILRRACSSSRPAGGTSRYHWHAGALVPGSSPPSVRTWRTVRRRS